MFTATPSQTLVGADVTFDASASAAVAPRTLLSYTWDLDGDGSHETTSSGPQLVHAFMLPGTVTVGLRVMDDMGGSAETTRTLTITSPPVVVPPPLVVVAAPPVLTVRAVAKQAKADTRGVAVTAACDQACSVVASGWISLPKGKRIVLGRLTTSLVAGAPTALTLKVPTKSKPTLRALLAAKKPVTATVKVTQSGVTLTRTIKLVK